MKKFFIPVMLLLLMLAGCGSDDSGGAAVPVLFDAPKFSKITAKQLKEYMGEPEKVEDYPLNGFDLDLYIYEEGKYEFYMHEDVVVQVNLNSGAYWGYDDSTFTYPGKELEKIFELFNIEGSKSARTVADTNYALRIESVNEQIYQVWITDIQDETFGTVKITYDPKYF